jgi:hypothetical protein
MMAMRDPEAVAARIAERLPQLWQRLALVPGLRERFVEVLRDPNYGELDEQISVLNTLLRQGDRLDDAEWTAWASYAFDPQIRQSFAYEDRG